VRAERAFSSRPSPRLAILSRAADLALRCAQKRRRALVLPVALALVVSFASHAEPGACARAAVALSALAALTRGAPPLFPLRTLPAPLARARRRGPRARLVGRVDAAERERDAALIARTESQRRLGRVGCAAGLLALPAAPRRRRAPQTRVARARRARAAVATRQSAPRRRRGAMGGRFRVCRLAALYWRPAAALARPPRVHRLERRVGRPSHRPR
jgi:hypothetical protein